MLVETRELPTENKLADPCWMDWAHMARQSKEQKENTGVSWGTVSSKCLECHISILCQSIGLEFLFNIPS